jgi:DNA mismatch repair protein MutS2
MTTSTNVPTPQLESNLAALEFDRVLALVELEARTSLGKEAIRGRRPCGELRACERAQAELSEMVRFYHREGQVPLAGLTDLRPLFEGESVLALEQSWQVLRAARATQAIRETFLRSEEYRLLRELAKGIDNLEPLIGKLARYFTGDGKLREEASAELRSIRSRIQTRRRSIQQTLSDLMNRSAEAIQEPLITLRGDRYCIPVRSDHRNAVPGILHERSGSGASFFIEPMAVVEQNNDLADLLIQEREEIVRITQLLSREIVDQTDALVASTATAGEFDALQACAIFYDTTRASLPRFSSDRELRLLGARHPLLDETLADARATAFGETDGPKQVIPTSITLDGQSPALVISGPNAGGKTVALKTIGLLVAMGASGLPIPAAEGTVLPVIDQFHVLIGDDQSVLGHLSTFSAYLMRLKRVLERASSKSLVLLDELGSGTDPEEGAALAAAVIEHMLESGALTVVTTHLSALKGFAVDDKRIVNASMEFDSATATPTFRLIVGIPGRSRAIDVAQMMGLPKPVIESARQRLGDRYGETDRLLAELQKTMSETLAMKDALADERGAVERERRNLQEQTAALEAERRKLAGKYREELDQIREETSRRLSSELRQLRESDKSAREEKKAREALDRAVAPVEEALEFVPADDKEIRAGDTVQHRRFKITGQVVSLEGSRATISVAGRKIQADLKDLAPVRVAQLNEGRGPKSEGKGPRAEGREKGEAKKSASSSPGTKKPASGPEISEAEVSAELNLIGHRVDEALEESDKFLDRSLLEGRSAVRIIHGFGTGALRKAVREHLRRHPAVRSWRPGQENEGGDGATIALLDT